MVEVAVTSVAALPGGKFSKTIESVTIPQPFAIGNLAFNFCTNLKTASFPAVTAQSAALTAYDTDVNDTTTGETWYSVGMERAMAEGISDGTNPESPISREQLAAMLYRYGGSPETAGTLDSFTDAGKAGGYATDVLRWAVEQGIISGKRNATLAPLGNATRAEVAAVLVRFLENTAK